MYGKAFSKIYNEFGWNYYPEAFGEKLIDWLAETGRKPKTALDIGCGTGVLCEIMAANGIDAQGVDLSEDMITVACARSSLLYEVGNMITYHPGRCVDLVTCTGDALNHIPDLEDIATVFRQVYSYLTPGGLFLFDILNEKETEESGLVELDYSDTVKGTFSITHEEEGRVHLAVHVYENGILQCEEHIHETVHDPETVCRLLQEAGFTDIACRHSLSEHEPQRAMTWFVIARKSE